MIGELSDGGEMFNESRLVISHKKEGDIGINVIEDVLESHRMVTLQVNNASLLKLLLLLIRF